MRPSAVLVLALSLTSLHTVAQVTDHRVNNYSMLDALKVYAPGEKVRVDEPHGVYSGLILMDDQYFFYPVQVSESEHTQDGVKGTVTALVRRATHSSWEKMSFSYGCDDRDLQNRRGELARTYGGEYIIGDHNAVCSLKVVSAADSVASPSSPVSAETSHLLVESWQTLLRQNLSVTAGHAVQFNFTLPARSRLLAQFQVQGGLNNKIQVFLLDVNNYQLYSSRQPFRYLPGASGSVRGVGSYVFQVPQDGVYYVVLDNGRAWLMPRTVTLHLDAILPQRTQQSEEIRKALENQYLLLKKLFIFPEFQTTVRHCGVVNAFSNPNITLCAELIEELVQQGMGSSIGFVYLHELGHTLMRQWGLPLWDNEDAADEFATAFLLIGKHPEVALQAAQWWASQGASTEDAVAKIWIDDRHSLSPQRARNIIRWVNNRNEIVPRWEHVWIPNMQTAALQSMLRDPNVADKDFIRSELSKRGAASSGM